MFGGQNLRGQVKSGVHVSPVRGGSVCKMRGVGRLEGRPLFGAVFWGLQTLLSCLPAKKIFRGRDTRQH